ncbi:hypothetical protein F7725_003750 [Dissostichus mawsoni]|uniref:Uncharacterized protein n=1 Tax=Dissostichus mawsoni TaxID=36200 RepID=A0A7J5YB31_DISMA|nr:hypothetical protein F7725_003750 [Dissostichus mawsoni]
MRDPHPDLTLASGKGLDPADDLCLPALSSSEHDYHMFVYVCFHPTYYDTVLPNVDVGTDLRCIDHTVLLDEDVVSDVQREESHSGGRDGGYPTPNAQISYG